MSSGAAAVPAEGARGEEPLSLQAHPRLGTRPSKVRLRENAAGIRLDAPGRNFTATRGCKPGVVLAVTPFDRTRRLPRPGARSTCCANSRCRPRPYRADDRRSARQRRAAGLVRRDVDHAAQGCSPTWCPRIIDAAVGVLCGWDRVRRQSCAALLVVGRGHCPRDLGSSRRCCCSTRIHPGTGGRSAAAGNLHAYLLAAIEIMAARTMCGGLAPKHIDVPEGSCASSVSPGAPCRPVPRCRYWSAGADLRLRRRVPDSQVNSGGTSLRQIDHLGRRTVPCQILAVTSGAHRARWRRISGSPNRDGLSWLTDADPDVIVACRLVAGGVLPGARPRSQHAGRN